jgi:hypothetical protein
MGTDSLGKDEDLGKKLVKGFFDTRSWKILDLVHGCRSVR